MNFVNADCEKIAIENPIGVMSTVYRKPDQIIQPYMFGEEERKATCLWLKNLPNLKATKIVKPNIIIYNNRKGTDSLWHMKTLNLPKNERQKERSKTFLGIAKAIAEQWGNNKKHYLLTNENTIYKTLFDTDKTDFNEALTKSRLLNYSIFVNV